MQGEPIIETYSFARVTDTTAACVGEEEAVRVQHKKMSVTLGQAIGLVIDGVLAYFGVQGA